jgi:hypothetical protein
MITAETTVFPTLVPVPVMNRPWTYFSRVIANREEWIHEATLTVTRNRAVPRVPSVAATHERRILRLKFFSGMKARLLSPVLQE